MGLLAVSLGTQVASSSMLAHMCPTVVDLQSSEFNRLLERAPGQVCRRLAISLAALLLECHG